MAKETIVQIEVGENKLLEITTINEAGKLTCYEGCYLKSKSVKTDPGHPIRVTAIPEGFIESGLS